VVNVIAKFFLGFFFLFFSVALQLWRTLAG
jgi:hypothetical protein